MMKTESDIETLPGNARATIREIEQGIVIPAGCPESFPEARATVGRMGIRMTYHGWPGLVQTRDGDLLVSASEGVLHVDPWRRHVLARSSDGGRTWSKAEVIFDSISEDRDLSLSSLPDGTLIATWFGGNLWAKPEPHPWRQPEWVPRIGQVKPDTLRALTRGWLRRSKDGGHTWEEHIHPTLVGLHAGPSALRNGNLVYLGLYRTEEGSTLVSTISEDGGLTWSLKGPLPVPHLRDGHTGKLYPAFNENHVVELASGELLAALRGVPEATSMNLHFSRSADGGETWSVPEDSGVLGHPPYLLRLACGVLLCLFGRRAEPRSIRAMFSYDDGHTWDTENIVTLASSQSTSGIDMGYPVAVEISPGIIYCVYYEVPKLDSESYPRANPEDYGIRSIRFRVDPPGV